MNCHYYSGITHTESQNSIIKLFFLFSFYSFFKNSQKGIDNMEIMNENNARMVYVTFKNKEPNHLEKEKKMKLINKFTYELIDYLAVNGIPIVAMDSIFESCLKLNDEQKGIHLEKMIHQRTLKNYHKRCSLCGKEKELTIHHIKQKSEYPELRYRLNNLMLVCKDCHKRMHMLPEDHTLRCIGDEDGIE